MAEQDPFQTPPNDGSARRKRPPVTIDLEAESVTPEPVVAEAAAEPAPPPLDEPPVEAEKATRPEDTIPEHVAESDPLPESVPPEPRLTRYWVPAIAALGGAVVGGLLVAFLSAPPGSDPILSATVDARFATLTSRLNSIAAADKLPTVDPQRIEALESEVASLKQQLAAAPSPAAAPDLKPLEDRIAALESKPAPTQAAPVDLSPLQAKIDQLATRMATLEAHPPVDPKTEAAARSIAVTTLRQAAERSGGFSAELAAAKGLGLNGSALDTLQPLAAQGAPSRAELIATYPAVSDAIRAASAKVDPNSGFFTKLAASAGSLVTVKPAGPLPGTSPAAVLSRMDAAMKSGDLAATLREGRDLDGYTRPVFADWAEKAKRRVDIDGALAGVDTASTSN